MSHDINDLEKEELNDLESIEYYDDDDDSRYQYDLSDAQEQWEESLRQIEEVMLFIIVPVVGKFFGRRFAYFAWSKIANRIYGREGPKIQNEAAFAVSAGAMEVAANI